MKVFAYGIVSIAVGCRYSKFDTRAKMICALLAIRNDLMHTCCQTICMHLSQGSEKATAQSHAWPPPPRP